MPGNKKPLYRFSFLSDSTAVRVAAFLRDQRHHQMPGRSWRAVEACGDGEPVGPDRPLEKGVGGIETGHQIPGRRIMKRWSCTARSPREDQALLLRRRLPLVPRAASPHGDNLAASHNASASHIYRHYTNILSGRRRVSTDKSHQNTTCPAGGGFPRTNHTAVATLLLSHLHGQ